MKTSKKTSHTMSHAQRSKSAAKAARSAWATMSSPAYIRAKKIGRKAVEAFLAKRRAA